MTSIRTYLASKTRTQTDTEEAVGGWVKLRALGNDVWRVPSEANESEKEGIKKRVVDLGKNFSSTAFDDHTVWISVRSLDVDSFHTWAGSDFANNIATLCSDENRQHMTAASIYVLTSTRFVEFRLQTANLFFGQNKKQQPTVSTANSGNTGDHSESIVYAAVLGILKAYCDINPKNFDENSGLGAVYTRNIGVLDRTENYASLGAKPAVFVTLINKQAPCEGCAKMWNELVGMVGDKLTTLWGSCQYKTETQSDIEHEVKT